MTDERPAHDPVAEEMDLLTHQEAEARLYDELESSRQRLLRLESSGEGDVEQSRGELQARVTALEAVVSRIRAERPSSTGQG